MENEGAELSAMVKTRAREGLLTHGVSIASLALEAPDFYSRRRSQSSFGDLY